MEKTLKDILAVAKEIPAEYFDETYRLLQEIKNKTNYSKKSENCPHCGSENVVRNGKHGGKQAYKCKNCGKTFLQTAESAIAYSHRS